MAAGRSQLDALLDPPLAESFTIVNDSVSSPLAGKSKLKGGDSGRSVRRLSGPTRKSVVATDAASDSNTGDRFYNERVQADNYTSIRRYERVLWLLSREIDFDVHPELGGDIESWDILLNELRKRRVAMEGETASYNAALARLQAETQALHSDSGSGSGGSSGGDARGGGLGCGNELARIEAQIKQAQDEEDTIRRQLQAIGDAQKDVRASLLSMVHEERSLHSAQADYFGSLNRLQADMIGYTEQRDSLQQQIGACGRSWASCREQTSSTMRSTFGWTDPSAPSTRSEWAVCRTSSWVS